MFKDINNLGFRLLGYVYNETGRNPATKKESSSLLMRISFLLPVQDLFIA
jgi:hypothetical protein